ncbi:bifunctional transcriptional activator/DNA repair enzyme AdaA [Flindersiella endophytica]
MTTYSAVVTTGIYCRPGCGAKPLAENVRTFTLAAAAEAAGFRACLRCRPYRIAGSLPWDAPELVCRAIQLIIAGALDDGSEAELGRRLGLSSRHLRRLFQDYLGLTPDQLARSRRAHFARRLLDDTDLAVVDIAFASGFGSLRQFNRTIREVFRATPQELRGRRRRADRLAADGGLTLRLPVSGPYDWDALGGLAAEAVPGVEVVDDDGTYRRTIALDGDPGLLEITRWDADHLLLRAHLPYWEGLIHVVERVRRMFGLDIDPTETSLASDPVIGPLIRARPGLRALGSWGSFEACVRAVVFQACDASDCRAILGRLAELAGPSVPGLPAGLTHAFPSAEAVAAADLGPLGLPPEVAGGLNRLATAIASGELMLDGSASLDELAASVGAATDLPPATVQRLAVRLGEPDAFPADLAGAAAAEAWRPWRSLAAVHLLANDAAAPNAQTGTTPQPSTMR